MLDTETKRRIDTARDILVGKVPDPKSQVEQITIALIYKFMDDMDAEAEELGGERSFFTGEFEKFGWSKLMTVGMGGYDMLNLYGEAITRMTENVNLPPLFRDIFKNAYLPYRDPETLKMFLKNINEFEYDHSERLGDAFEYLLSVLGSQGDAGQFRTPRHIIEFIVDVVNPTKSDTILDPACGTAGFLIEAYKHILGENKDKQPGDKLSPDDRKRLYENIKGYDISPDMVRLSLVNLYLHGFVNPQVYEYDTLSSDERWNEYADVILANPPFMSPKGGIKPHKRFSVQSSRSEVLFVDYMAEHLTPTGRAGIIVPEGVIFQSSNAYKGLRKMLVDENILWAVVSLPAGVFNPYSGVRTSILLFDKALAKKTDKILFVKVEADGFDLGAQRRPNGKDDLPDALECLRSWQTSVQQNQTEGFDASFYSLPVTIVPKAILAESDYNLTGDSYREVVKIDRRWKMVTLEEIVTLYNGKAYKQDELLEKGKTPVLRVGNLFTNRSWYYSDLELDENKYCETGDLLYAWSASFGPFIWDGPKAIYHYHIWKIEHSDKVEKKFLYYMLQKVTETIKDETHGIAMLHMTKANMEKVQIPLPPLEVQQQIVNELEGYQRIIDGAGQVVEGWKPNLELELDEARKSAGVDEWKMVLLSDACEQISDTIDPNQHSGEIDYIGLENIESNTGVLVGEINSKYEDIKSTKNRFKENDILYGKLRPNLNKVSLVNFSGICSTDIYVLRAKENAEPMFLANYIRSENFNSKVLLGISGAQLPRVNFKYMGSLQIPLPPLEVQREIVSHIEAEREIVEANKRLIEIYDGKIKQVIARVWEG